MLSKVINYINYEWPKKIEEQLKPYFRCKSELSVENSCILLGGRVIVPMHLWTKFLTEIDDNHPGIVKMKNLVRSYIFFFYYNNTHLQTKT